MEEYAEVDTTDCIDPSHPTTADISYTAKRTDTHNSVAEALLHLANPGHVSLNELPQTDCNSRYYKTSN